MKDIIFFDEEGRRRTSRLTSRDKLPAKLDSQDPEVILKRMAEDHKATARKYIYSCHFRSSVYSWMHNILQLIIFIGAATVTVIVSITTISKIIPAIISGAIALATGISNYYKFNERAQGFRLIAEDALQEYNLFITDRGKYKGLESKEALNLFVDRLEELMRERMRYSIIFEKVTEIQSMVDSKKENEK